MMHVAETEEQAIAEVAYGYDASSTTSATSSRSHPTRATRFEEQVRAANRTGRVCFGTPEMARAQIQRLLDKSGGFGTYLFMGGDFATPEATTRS